MSDDTTELTPAEREAFAKLERTMPLDPLQQERTVRALYAEGLLGARGATGAGGASAAGTTLDAFDARRRLRPLRVALAIAAGLGCFLAGRLSERAGLWGGRTEAATATAPSATANTPGALADAQQRAPVIRF
jgi:hypothetical protein